MANTPNFALYKPNRGDTTVEVDASLSDNFTKIDTELKNNKDGLDTHKNDPNAHTSENVSHADGSVKSTLENHEERIGDLETDADALEIRVNDIETLGLDVLAPTLEGRIQTIESDVEGFLAPATFDAMDQQSYTFDEYRIGYVVDKLSDISPHLKSMGAVLDGVTDDAPVINAYINQIPTSGKVRNIVLPDTTICVSTIVINTPNVKLSGGKNTVLKKKSTAPSGEDFIQVLADDVEVKTIKFDGNNTSNGFLVNANYNVSPFVQRKNIKIEGLRYTSTHANGRGIIVGYYDGVEISGCVLENTVGTPNTFSFGIAVWSDQNILSTMMTKNIHIHHNQIKGFYHGINSWGTGNGSGGNRQRMSIVNNIVEKCYQSGIYSYHSPRSIVAHNLVRNCGDIGIWSDSGADYEYEYSDGTQGYGNRVIGNTIYSCRVGILTEEFRYGVIAQNTIFKCTDYGIGIGGGTDSSSINGNTVFENGHGIFIDKNINPNTYYIFDLELNGNIVKRNKYHGIRIGGTRKSVKIIGGFVTDNGTINIGVPTPSINYAGIWIGKDKITEDGSNATQVRISNVDISNGFDYVAGLTEAGVQAYGIYCMQSAVNQVMITTCYFSGNTINHIYAPWMTSGVTVKDTTFLTTNIGNNVGNSLLYTSGNVGLLTDYQNGKSSFVLDGKWNTDHLVMNGNHIWVDSGKVYIKTSAPTTATDGTVIGTQV